MVISNLISNGITSTKDTINRTQMLGTEKYTTLQITPAKYLSIYLIKFPTYITYIK